MYIYTYVYIYIYIYICMYISFTLCMLRCGGWVSCVCPG